MSLLDRARKIDCLCDASEGYHSGGCILTFRPQLIEALEIVSEMLTAIGDNPIADPKDGAGRGFYDALHDTCLSCGASSYGINPHWEWCRWPRLVELLA
jgi:hypothetical protein